MKSPRRVVALVSGGMDSLILIRTLTRRSHAVWPLYVRFGLVWERAEVSSLRRWLPALKLRHVQPLTVASAPMGSLYGAHWSVTGRHVPSSSTADKAVRLPGRNLVLLTQAAILGARHRAHTLALGTLAANPFGDATPGFFRAFAACLGQALDASYTIAAPLRRFTKAQLIRRFPREPYHLTVSCLRPHGARHCGRCNKCAERRRAFRIAHITDPTRYVASTDTV